MAALLHAHLGGDLATVIKRRILQDIEQPARAPSFGVDASKDDPGQSHMHDRSGTHGAWFLGDKKFAFIQPPRVEHTLGLGDREHFRVSGGVAELFHLIISPGDNLSFMSNHRPDGDFFCRIRTLCLPEGFPHEIVVAL